MNTKKLNCLLVEGIHKQADCLLEKEGFRTKRFKQTLPTKELLENLKDVSVLCSRSRTQINQEILLNSNLDCIGAFCIGVNQIDLVTACRQGVPVFNAPYSNTRSVAEMLIGLIISLSRKLCDHSKKMHQGQWDKFSKDCFEVRGKSLGIIGYGHIGSQVSVLAENLGMKVLYYDIQNKLPIGNAKVASNLKSLLQESDFVTLHVPETAETKNLIGKKEIQLMKKGGRLINTSRGQVVNLSDLKEALDSTHLAGAAIDVFPEEPKKGQDSFSCLLQNTKNVILTPHIGGSTEEAQLSIALEVSHNLKNFLFTGATQDSVNFPSLFIPPIAKNITRISNIHKNQPGVLTQINKLVSESGANIKAQYLATNEWIGYLVMDLEKESVQQITQKISKLEVNIKTRVMISHLDHSQAV